MNYAVGVEPGNVINLGFFDGVVQDVALFNNHVFDSTVITPFGSGEIRDRLETSTFTGNTRVFHYDFRDNSVYANYCLD